MLSVLVWLAMQGQVQAANPKLDCIQGHCAEFSHMPLHTPWSPRWTCLEVRQYTDGTLRIYGGDQPHCDSDLIYGQTELPQPAPKPAEHVIEIKTVRGCNKGGEVCMVIRELWIDGVRWGVVKGLE